MKNDLLTDSRDFPRNLKDFKHTFDAEVFWRCVPVDREENPYEYLLNRISGIVPGGIRPFCTDPEFLFLPFLNSWQMGMEGRNHLFWPEFQRGIHHLIWLKFSTPVSVNISNKEQWQLFKKELNNLFFSIQSARPEVF